MFCCADQIKTSKKQFALKSLFNVSDWREAARMNLQACGNDCIFHIEEVYENHRDESPYMYN